MLSVNRWPLAPYSAWPLISQLALH